MKESYTPHAKDDVNTVPGTPRFVINHTINTCNTKWIAIIERAKKKRKRKSPRYLKCQYTIFSLKIERKKWKKKITHMKIEEERKKGGLEKPNSGQNDFPKIRRTRLIIHFKSCIFYIYLIINVALRFRTR